MKFVFTIFLSLICLFSMINGQNVPDLNNNSNKAAQELWEKVIEAKGGRENLYAIKTLVVSSKPSNSETKKEVKNSKYEELFVLPDKWWWWLDERPDFSLDIWQYDFGKEIVYEVREVFEQIKVRTRNVSELPASFDKKVRLISDERFNSVKQKYTEHILLYLMETKSFQPTIIGMRNERVGGQNIIVIETSEGQLKTDYFIDPKTYLPNRVEIKTWIESTKSYYEDGLFLEDYTEVNGVKFPQVIRRGRKSDMKTTYQVNVKYDENLFSKPPNLNNGSDGWKPKQ